MLVASGYWTAHSCSLTKWDDQHVCGVLIGTRRTDHLIGITSEIISSNSVT